MHDLDHTQRFLFDDNDVRGEMVSLAESYQHVLAKHPYPQPVAQLLGDVAMVLVARAQHGLVVGEVVLIEEGDDAHDTVHLVTNASQQLSRMKRFKQVR